MRKLTIVLASIFAALSLGGSAFAGPHDGVDRVRPTGWTCIQGCEPTPDPAPPICHKVPGGQYCQY